MILLYLSIFLYYNYNNCDEINTAKFKESPIENHHGRISNVSAVFKDVKHRRNAETPVPRAFDHEQQITNPEFMDYSITELWWNGTPGIEQTDQITPQMSILLSTPIGHGKFPGDIYSYSPYNPLPIPERTEPIEVQDKPLPPPTYTSKDNDLPPSITRPTFPFPIETSDSSPGEISTYHPYTTHYPEPLHPQYPGLTPPPGFPSDYRYPTIYPPSPPQLTPKIPSFTFLSPPDVDRPGQTSPTPTYFPNPGVYPPRFDPNLPIIPQSTSPSIFQFSFTTLNPTVGEYVKMWLQEMANSTAKWLPRGWTYTPPDHAIIDYTTTTEQFPPIGRANTNARNQIMQLKIHDLPRPVQRLGVIVHRDKTVVNKHELQPNNTTTPNKDAKTTDGRPTNITKDTNVNSSIPAATKYMIHNHRKVRQQFRVTTGRSYYKMIEKLDEGYLIVFLIELTRIIAMKDKTEVFEVIMHADSIVYRVYKTGELVWFGHPLIDVTRKMARLLLETEIGVTQRHAAQIHNTLKTRNKSLSTEVNTILEYADMLYTDAEGKRLFRALKDFDKYPNITLTGYWLCDSLIENFMRPYRRLSHKQRVRRLVDSINLALISRFPQLKITLRQPEALVALLEPVTEIQQKKESEEKKIVTQKEILTQKEYHTETTSTTTHKSTTTKRKRKRKHHFRSHERNGHRKRRKHRYRSNFATGNIYYRRQYSQDEDYVYPLLRSMKPITSVQKRFRIVTSKYQWKPTNIRTRSAFFVNLMTRPTRSYSFGGSNRNPRFQTNTPFPIFHENFDALDRPNFMRRIQPTDDSGGYSSTLKTIHKDKTFFYRHVEDLTDTESEEKAEGLNLNTELLRRIVDGPIEEEESMNLIDALINGKMTFNIQDDNTSN